MTESKANPMLGKLDEISSLLRELVRQERPRPQRLMRLKDAAAYLAISTWALRTLIQNGEIPVIKVNDNGGHSPWLVDRNDLDTWVERAK